MFKLKSTSVYCRKPFLAFLLLTLSVPQYSQVTGWTKLDTGLYFSEIVSPIRSKNGDSKITVLKINPKHYEFKLISAKVNNESYKTVKEWVNSKNLIAGINAGLYQVDGKTNVGFMKDYDFINNNFLSRENAILAFNRKDSTLPEIQIIDLKCKRWEDLKNKYNSYSQCIRMVDCNQNNTWSQQPREYSIACIAIDKSGNALFIFTQSPYSVHNFINILLQLPLNIYNAMYLEGSSPATFYLNYNGWEIEKTGSILSSGENGIAWEVPNIIGIVKK